MRKNKQSTTKKDIDRPLIDNIQADINVLKDNERNDILEPEALFAVIQNASVNFP